MMRQMGVRVKGLERFKLRKNIMCYLNSVGNSLVVQWLGLHAFTAKGAGSIPGRGTKIPQAAQNGQKKKFKLCILSNSLLKIGCQ